MRIFVFLLTGIISLCSGVYLLAREEIQDSGIPPIQQMRDDERYTFLQEKDSARIFLKSLKWILMNPKEDHLADLRNTYFIASNFIRASGNAENIFHIAPTISFRF